MARGFRITASYTHLLSPLQSDTPPPIIMALSESRAIRIALAMPFMGLAILCLGASRVIRVVLAVLRALLRRVGVLRCHVRVVVGLRRGGGHGRNRGRERRFRVA